MPVKGQKCANCAGDCCSVVTFIAVDAARLKKSLMDLDLQELKELGYKEVYRPHNPCTAKTREGCTIYDKRPKLCRSYYCHGRHWRQK